MGASSGWNLVARRPQRARVAPKRSARHLVSVPCGPDAPGVERIEHGERVELATPPAPECDRAPAG